MSSFKNGFFLIILISFFLTKCKKEDNSTGILKIDNHYKFSHKESFKINNDTLNTEVYLFYLNKSDSIFIIEGKKSNENLLKAYGWSNNKGKIGHWHYEKFSDNKFKTDSVVNYVNNCNEQLINDLKIFDNDRISKSKGYFYEIKMNNNIKIKDTLKINIELFYDTIAFEKPLKTFSIFKPINNDNFCNASDRVIDKFLIDNNKIEMNFLIDRIGNHTFYGFYYLPYKSQIEKDKISTKQIFIKMNFTCN